MKQYWRVYIIARNERNKSIEGTLLQGKMILLAHCGETNIGVIVAFK